MLFTYQYVYEHWEISEMSKVRKIIDEAKESKNPELDLVDKGISSFDEIPNLRKLPSIL